MAPTICLHRSKQFGECSSGSYCSNSFVAFPFKSSEISALIQSTRPRRICINFEATGRKRSKSAKRIQQNARGRKSESGISLYVWSAKGTNARWRCKIWRNFWQREIWLAKKRFSTAIFYFYLTSQLLFQAFHIQLMFAVSDLHSHLDFLNGSLIFYFHFFGSTLSLYTFGNIGKLFNLPSFY